MSQLKLDGHTVTVERDVQPVTSWTPERDPDWRETDSNGHEHHMADSGYPTLEWVVTETYFCHLCQEVHDEGEWRCRLCGLVIHPGTRTPGTQFVFTGEHYYIDGEPVTKAAVDALLAQYGVTR